MFNPTTSLADCVFLSSVIPDDDAYAAPRWFETVPGVWHWAPATIEDLAGVVVLQIGTMIERCSSLDAALWIARDVYGVEPLIIDSPAQLAMAA